MIDRMTKSPTRVAIVVEPDSVGHWLIWLGCAVERLHARAAEDPNNGTTTFKVDFAVARDAWVAE
jgi:hypothetical protein